MSMSSLVPSREKIVKPPTFFLISRNVCFCDQIDPLIQPALLRAQIPLTENAKRTISATRAAVAAVLSGESDKIVVIVGPCSIHNVDEALEYARLLKAQVENFPELVLVMRTYFEKVSFQGMGFQSSRVKSRGCGERQGN